MYAWDYLSQEDVWNDLMYGKFTKWIMFPDFILIIY